MKKCPKCGNETFYVTAHVVQNWIVDSNGDFLEVIDDCYAVAHFPDDDDLWECAKCNYSDGGDKFNVKDGD